MKTSNERGSALLTVLWLSAALSAIAFSVASSVRAETDRVEADSNGLRAYYLATGAVERGIQWMVWADQDIRNADGSPKFWEPNLPRLNMTFPSGSAVVEMIPESSKLNINSASPDQLTRLIAVVSGDEGKAREIAAGIVDWRSGAAEPTAFDEYYSGIAPTFRARHASFQEIEELLFVRGMTPELFYGNYLPGDQGVLYATGGLRDALSVWGSTSGFDVNTVSPALMASLGMTPDAVHSIVTRRTAAPFKNLGEVGELGVPSGGLGIGGNYIWTLRASARLKPSGTLRTASATVKLVNRKLYQIPVHVLRWYDDAWSEAAISPAGVTR
jgi:general secretion pathway protein K